MHGNRLARRVSAVSVALLAIAALAVVIYGTAMSPDGAPPPTPTPTAPSAAGIPATGRVIGVMAVPVDWKRLGASGLPFTIGYPPGWRVKSVTASPPVLFLVDRQSGATLTISGRDVRRGGEMQRALTPLALTPVPHTLDPPIFIRSYPYVPTRSQVTNVVAFVQGGYLWTARLVEAQDMHLPARLHTLQAMLATFRLL